MPSAEALAAARVMLSQLGISAADLTAPPVAVPTFAEVIPQVIPTLKPGTLRTYNTHFQHLLDRWATRRLDEPTPAELDAFAHEIVAAASTNRASRGGRGAGENFVAATRCLYRFAEGRWINAADNPARNLKKPARRPAQRFAIPAQQLTEICRVAATTGTDPNLDSLILRLVTETACRRGGALALRPRDLDPDQCLVFLREKNDSDRWQPVSPTLMQYLLDHAAERGSPPSGQLLRYRDGRPITSRRFDNLWQRVRAELPWAAAQGISTHWLRHTTLTWVERNFSHAVARAYAGHNDNTHGITATYVKADLIDVASALSGLTGEPHPLGSDRQAITGSSEFLRRR
ncbi:tyrosine-type recombinase/integrase [Nocardia grenadensis]|uniref:tyrosine-type recombinase/integrase n=1 Tax=Nocardia grenadensis TaxID=931537 RepID=UPI003D8C351D